MKKFFGIVLILCLVACSSNEEVENNELIVPEENLADTLSEEFEEVSEEIVELTEDELNLIDNFLEVTITDEFSIDKFCFEEEDIKSLLMGAEVPEYGWNSKKINIEKNYLEVSNDECYSTISFRMFFEGEDKYAYLDMGNKGASEFYFLFYHEQKGFWVNMEKMLPYVKNEDFYDGLTDEESEIVKEYGDFGIYLSEDKVTYLYHDWIMGQNLDYADIEFNREADFKLGLVWIKNAFRLDTIRYE